MEQVKQFKTYGEQVELLRQRGMRVNDPEHAEMLLARLNYYRLSRYWYPMRRFSQGDGTAQDEFVDGASFDLVVALYRFEEQLRHSVFIELDRVELAIRTKLGHELGRLDPLIYLDPQRLNARARQRNKDGRSVYEVWLRKYQSALKASKEDFVAHHKSKYGGTLPIWAAVEIMDWGMLSYLYGMSPNIVRKRIAQPCDLTGPQLESWLKFLLAPPTGLVSSRPATEAVRHLPAQSHRAVFSHRRTRQLARVASLARLILAVLVAFVLSAPTEPL